MLFKIDTCQPSDTASHTKTYQNHLPVSFCYNVKYSNTSKSNLVTYSGEDAAKVFYEKIKEETLYIAKNYLDVKKPMITKEQETEFEKENDCHICKKSLSDLPPILVPRFILVFFHNLSGSDTHLFIKELGIDKDNIKTIAISEDNYVSFSKNIQYIHIDPITKNPVLDQKGKPIFKTVEIRFLDSSKFLSSSLKKLAYTLKPYQFKELSKHYPDQLDLVKGKLVYPYEYMDSPEKYDEESLPNIDKLYSSLTGEHEKDS
ncbi:Ribonuclease H-like domain [Cinara cedri]|uniref:Ribonuclease H-like domain n=1 Tax=Cinara cedri TaxID=506608 RepID=A0A5E4NH11_9HEMI|nr:Ribonuclease H-like domain [Cinara cedri]